MSHLRCRPCIALKIILVICAEISSIAALDTAGPGAASPRPHAAINCIFISALNLAPARPLPSHYTLGRAKMQIFQYQAGFCSSSAATCPLCLHHPSGSCLIMRGGDTSPPPPHHRHLAGVENRASNKGSWRFHNHEEGLLLLVPFPS